MTFYGFLWSCHEGAGLLTELCLALSTAKKLYIQIKKDGMYEVNPVFFAYRCARKGQLVILRFAFVRSINDAFAYLLCASGLPRGIFHPSQLISVVCKSRTTEDFSF